MTSTLSGTQRLTARLLTLLARAWALVPVASAQRLGAAVGWCVDLFPNREREIATANLAACFPSMDAAERRRFRRRVLVQTGQLLAEMPATWFRPLSYWERRIEAADFEGYVREVLGRGKGVIFAAPHLGNWEISLITLARIAPITAMYRPPRQAVLEPLLMAGREKGGASLVPATARGVRAMHAALSRGEMVGILPDQAPKKARSGAGEFAPFFGIPAYTMTLVPRLARRTGAPVVFLFAERGPRGRFVLRWCEAPEGIVAADESEAVAALNGGVERCVRRRPEQYLWTYKRFSPSSPGMRSVYSRKKKKDPA